MYINANLIDVYTDPIEKRHYEGKARILNILGQYRNANGIMTKADVKFEHEPNNSYVRYIWEEIT